MAMRPETAAIGVTPRVGSRRFQPRHWSGAERVMVRPGEPHHPSNAGDSRPAKAISTRPASPAKPCPVSKGRRRTRSSKPPSTGQGILEIGVVRAGGVSKHRRADDRDGNPGKGRKRPPTSASAPGSASAITVAVLAGSILAFVVLLLIGREFRPDALYRGATLLVASQVPAPIVMPAVPARDTLGRLLGLRARRRTVQGRGGAGGVSAPVRQFPFDKNRDADRRPCGVWSRSCHSAAHRTNCFALARRGSKPSREQPWSPPPSAVRRQRVGIAAGPRHGRENHPGEGFVARNGDGESGFSPVIRCFSRIWR